MVMELRWDHLTNIDKYNQRFDISTLQVEGVWKTPGWALVQLTLTSCFGFMDI